MTQAGRFLPVDDRFTKRLGMELRRRREARELAQEQVAVAAGLSRNYVSLIELGQYKVTVEKLVRLCRALDTTASAVLASVEADT